jgi:hypothetical protein
MPLLHRNNARPQHLGKQLQKFRDLVLPSWITNRKILSWGFRMFVKSDDKIGVEGMFCRQGAQLQGYRKTWTGFETAIT